MTRNSKSSRQAAETKGRWAEAAAAALLRAKGYKILNTRFKCSVGEIDIVASKKGLVAFVEVKARKNTAQAFESVTEKQKHRIEKAALYWLQQQGSQEVACRFDVIAVAPGKLPSHMMDAWRPGW